MPRPPTKNRINMHDIVGQPLGALADAVDAVLRRPEALDDVEVKGIFREASFVLLRAEEALSSKDDKAFCALLKLFSEGFAHSEESFEEGIKTFTLHGALLQTIHSLFRVVVEQKALALHSPAAVELVQVISSLCDGEALKESCGTLFLDGLARTLTRIYADPAEAQRHYHLQRAVASALINLVKGSKQNKARLVSLRFAAECCAASVDVFFQLQCVELLFRVSRQNKAVLQGLEDSLPIVEQLASLPNDGTLLSRMTALVEQLNVTRPDVLLFHLTQLVAADMVLTEATEAYFSPHFLIVMVTTTNADNITIPYTMIRSVTLGRDGRVLFKLEEFPVKLEVLLSRTAGMDTVTLHMSMEQLTVFKQSPIRAWIISALQARKEEQRGDRAAGITASPAGTKRAAAAAAAAAEDRASRPSERINASVGKLSMTSPLLRQGLADGEKTLTGVDGMRKKAKVETVSAGEPIENEEEREDEWKHKRAADTVAGSSLRVGSAQPPSLPQSRQGSAVALKRAINDVIQQQQSANPRETQAVLTQLKRLIEAKLEVRRGESVVTLNETMARIQSMVDDTRRTAKEARTTWQSTVMPEVEHLERHVSETQDLAAAAVERLNDDLREVKSSNQALNERIACIEIELQQSLEESRELESKDWREIRVGCDRELERLEYELDQRLLHRANPGAVLGDYLHATANRVGF